ncbi:glyoxylase-like metal-dependent hydrolase (beta-lactamase superfamily II) [Rhodoligotrophos appendicifer]|uniref:MBL fold metallo-hydrolase n=1 Tax=Rhodoligotrophos appendicifer TaxID=987056 RepID=UPI00117FA9B9|nr:MBL fold metallo-hydrolase [Rhodoligotrophos appendicifer]
MTDEYANGWFQSQSVGDGITLIRETKIKPQYRANIWFVRGKDRNMIVDTGFGLVSLLKNINFLSEKPILAVATHSHCDHIGGHYEFSHSEIHEAEADILERPTNSNTVAQGYVSREMYVDDKDRELFNLDAYFIHGTHPKRLLAEGDLIDLGDRTFEILHLPGHSPGGIGLFERATGILFSGDMVHNGETGIGRYMLYHSDLDDWLTSVERLQQLPVKKVHAGHYDSFDGDRYSEILDEYLERRRTPNFPLVLNSYDVGEKK